MPRVKFTKQSISPVVWFATVAGAKFATISKAKGEATYAIEFNGVPGKYSPETLADAMATVRQKAGEAFK